jgi:hypothetical protein
MRQKTKVERVVKKVVLAIDDVLPGGLDTLAILHSQTNLGSGTVEVWYVDMERRPA